MDAIGSIEDIIRLAALHPYVDWKAYGEVSVDEDGNLLLFNYTPKAIYQGRWNFFETVSRGLIIDRVKGEVAARAFDRFFNWGEGGRTTTAPIVSVTEKVDGSLGVLYRKAGGFAIATRGSFSSPQAQWATEHLNRNYNKRYTLDFLHPDLTLIFEIVYPENRVVVDYGDIQGLYLLAARDRRTGQFQGQALVNYLAWQGGFTRPKSYHFEKPEDLLASARALDRNHEGFVAEFADGSRFKFKGEQYLELASMLTSLTFNRVLEAVQAGTLQQLREGLPEEFRPIVNQWEQAIELRVEEVTNQVEDAYTMLSARLGPVCTRKDFALAVKADYPRLAAYLFLKQDGKPYRQQILKQETFTSQQEPVTA